MFSALPTMGSAASAILPPRNGTEDVTLPSSSTRVLPPSATRRWTADTSIGAPAIFREMVLWREPSAAGASQFSVWVTLRLSPTNLRAISGRRVVGSVRTEMVLNSPAMSPATVKDSRLPPTYSLVWRWKSSFAKTAVTLSTPWGRVVEALSAIDPPSLWGQNAFCSPHPTGLAVLPRHRDVRHRALRRRISPRRTASGPPR